MRISPTCSLGRLHAVVLCASMLLVGACVGSESADGGPAADLRSDLITEQVPYSMALGSIDAAADRISSESNVVAVVVPSDDALLALDADRLAELAGDGGLESLIIQLERSDDVDLSSPPAIEGSEEFVFSASGSAHLLRAVPPVRTFADQPIRVIEQRGDLTVIVVDGIVEP